jgi:hypothetical protein
MVITYNSTTCLELKEHNLKLHCQENLKNQGKGNMEHQLDAKITILLISNISSTCFGQSFAHLQERKTEIFTTYGIMSC